MVIESSYAYKISKIPNKCIAKTYQKQNVLEFPYANLAHMSENRTYTSDKDYSLNGFVYAFLPGIKEVKQFKKKEKRMWSYNL